MTLTHDPNPNPNPTPKQVLPPDAVTRVSDYVPEIITCIEPNPNPSPTPTPSPTPDPNPNQ
eukprot:scaffold30544_cov49-Phaeocystis_antarctica.AAC.1